ncbi:hypothetical protein [Kibdelosporangium aridum]|uniref:hypothetical protein n=1 Tax=Kibdelosporangium aridum TaxID=2030 RepID=UPI00135C06F4|nr:hypothetical protein [Kibdelosporangium aridum]
MRQLFAPMQDGQMNYRRTAEHVETLAAERNPLLIVGMVRDLTSLMPRKTRGWRWSTS